MNTHKFGRFFLVACYLLLCSCVAKEPVSPLPAPTVAPTRWPTLSPQSDLAAYLLAVIPSPGAVLGEVDYLQGDHARQTVFETEITAQRVCIELYVVPLLLSGDDLSSPETVVERLSLTVDGLSQASLDRPVSSFLERYTILDEQGQATAQGGGPFLFCWQVPLDSGVHTAKVSFSKTSGRILEYEWSFIIRSRTQALSRLWSEK